MNYFFHDIIKKYVVAVSYIFQDIHVQKFDAEGTLQKDITVPISYFGKEKIINMLNQTHSDYNNLDIAFDTTDQEQNIAQLVPRIGFTDLAPEYDKSRKRNNTITYTSADQTYEIGEPVPWNIPFDVSVYTKRKDDMNQIVEQLLTVFTPEIMMNVNTIPELGIVEKIPIVLNSVTYNNQDEYSQEENRYFITDFKLTLKGAFYPKISDAGLIEMINVNLRDMDTAKLMERIHIDYNGLCTITTSEAVDGV